MACADSVLLHKTPFDYRAWLNRPRTTAPASLLQGTSRSVKRMSVAAAAAHGSVRDRRTHGIYGQVPAEFRFTRVARK